MIRNLRNTRTNAYILRQDTFSHEFKQPHRKQSSEDGLSYIYFRNYRVALRRECSLAHRRRVWKLMKLSRIIRWFVNRVEDRRGNGGKFVWATYIPVFLVPLSMPCGRRGPPFVGIRWDRRQRRNSNGDQSRLLFVGSVVDGAPSSASSSSSSPAPGTRCSRNDNHYRNDCSGWPRKR